MSVGLIFQKCELIFCKLCCVIQFECTGHTYHQSKVLSFPFITSGMAHGPIVYQNCLVPITPALSSRSKKTTFSPTFADDAFLRPM